MSSSSKFYIYRNLHRGNAFSIRYDGRVIDRRVDFVAFDVQFKVNQAGRLQVIRNRQKNVHAFVVAGSWAISEPINIGTEVSYNPYNNSTFMANGESILSADAVCFRNGRCYILR